MLRELQIPLENLVAAMHDRAATNGKAIRIAKTVYDKLFDVGCFSHAVDLVGSHFETPNLSKFMVHWIGIFSYSPKANLMWKARSGSTMNTFSKTRWWSRWEVEKQIWQNFQHVHDFLQDLVDEKVCPAHSGHCLHELKSNSTLLLIEIQSLVEGGERFVKATYNLEGYGALLPKAYTILRELELFCQNPVFPTLAALCGNNAQLYQYGVNCLMPGLNYFCQLIDGELSASMQLFRAARVFSPHCAIELNLSPEHVYTLNRAVPSIISATDVPFMIIEIPAFLASAEDVSPDIDLQKWWKDHSQTLQYWAKAARILFLIQPSSAASERVFSLLNRTFRVEQTLVLEDYVEISLQLQYNNFFCNSLNFNVSHFNF
eukprot:Pompholyxophrys_sp_v1_NODE_68_length_2521_cov_1.980130.p1 type:complete len:374 gc:universal NODE_68_length_2521_cov_1.980130:1353-232(-)